MLHDTPNILLHGYTNTVARGARLTSLLIIRPTFFGPLAISSLKYNNVLST
jgi:hypothetical protein